MLGCLRCAVGARRRRGVVLVWVAITFLVLLLFMGLALDIAYLVLTNHQLQNAADASALAGVARVKRDTALAHDRALAIAGENFAAGDNVSLVSNVANEPGGDIVIGRYDLKKRTFTPTLTNPNAVKVHARRTAGSPDQGVPLLFGPMFGIETAFLAKPAIAMVNEVRAGIIVLDPDADGALRVHGTPGLVLYPTGGIIVNSRSNSAMVVSGSVHIQAPEIDIYGNYTVNGGPTIDADIETGAYPVQDPLAGLPAPADGPVQKEPKNGAPWQPGHYKDGIKIANGTHVFEPGVYVVDEGMKITGGTLVGEGVMFYIKSGSCEVSGNAVLELSPATSGTYEGITFFQARGNTEESKINGTAETDLRGTLYFPSALLSLTGTAETFSNQLIAWQLDVGGNETFDIEYDGRFPAPGRVFLVE